MRLSNGVEWALHCCTVLALLPAEQTLSATRLAEFHEVPPAYLAKHLQALAGAEIVEATSGPRGGYRLTRPPDAVTVLDVVVAVDGAAPAFHCEEIRQRGPSACGPRAYPKPCGIARVMAGAEQAWRAALRNVTVADLVDDLGANVHPQVARKGAAWLKEAVR